MKNNIHVLTTDKPSRLYLTTQEYIFEEGYSLSTDECENKHIYITSDEEIKEGDWFLTPINDLELANKEWMSTIAQFIPKTNFKKIILTTDQDLIKDGVQAIDNEFLEWFVKNPNCESVEVVDDTLTVKEMSSLPLGTRNHKYKIIIPKEIGFKVENGKRTETFYQEPKQETLEEVPTELESVLAKITHQNDLGLSQWHEVVYYDNKWCSYSGSKTFQDGEKVIEWKYCKDLI